MSLNGYKFAATTPRLFGGSGVALGPRWQGSTYWLIDETVATSPVLTPKQRKLPTVKPTDRQLDRSVVGRYRSAVRAGDVILVHIESKIEPAKPSGWKRNVLIDGRETSLAVNADFVEHVTRCLDGVTFEWVIVPRRTLAKPLLAVEPKRKIIRALVMPIKRPA